MRIFWDRLVGLHREVEATPWGGLLLGNIWPAYLFALPLGARVWNVWHAQWGDSPDQRARLLQEVVTIVFLGLVVLLFAIRRRGIAGQRTTLWPAAVALVGTFLLNVVGYLPIEQSTSTDALLVSSGVVVLGTVWTTWSLATLGRCFGLFPEVRGLVKRGPYRLVRHPVYLGEVVSAIGLLIARPHVLIIAIFAVFVALQYWRTVYEERALAAAFPNEYPAYTRRVPRLVPGLHA
jgi:protein-S-isoprenylcysteine O-methyltransferase Ste14